MAREYRTYRTGRSIFGPILLIGIGVLFLLATQHVLSFPRLGYLFSRYWPALLILAGVVRLFEFIWARQSDRPTPRFGGGGIALVILLIIFGYAVTSAHRFGRDINWDSGDMDMNGPWADTFRGEPHEYDLRQDVPMEGNNLSFHADRADITVVPSSDDKAHVLTHLTVYSHSQEEADSAKGKFSLNATPGAAGTSVNAGNMENAKLSFEVQVPDRAALDLANGRGDITVRDRKGAVTIATQRGDVTVENIAGALTIHSSGSKTSVTAHQVSGDVLLQGKYEDVTATDLASSLSLDGDFYGDVRLKKVAKGVRFHSSRTDMEFAKLDGDFDMSRGDLQVTSVAGPVRVNTSEKSLNLQKVSGDVDLTDQNASIELQPELPIGNIRVQNKRGSIDFVVPEGANFTLQARADSGEINSDIGIEAQSDDHGNSSASGTVGKGGNRVILTADKGSINLRKQ